MNKGPSSSAKIIEKVIGCSTNKITTCTSVSTIIYTHNMFVWKACLTAWLIHSPTALNKINMRKLHLHR